MCDDFFDDDMDGMDDAMFDPSDDFQEDLFDEQNDGLEGLIDEDPEAQVSSVDTNGKVDMADAVIMGSMIVGNAYEEAIDEKRRAELIKKMREKNRRNK